MPAPDYDPDVQPAHSTETSVLAWDAAAGLPDYQGSIHPTGNDPEAYRASGQAAAAELLATWAVYGDPLAHMDDPLSVLEFGCGDGRILLEWHDGWERWGCDASQNMLQRLHERAQVLDQSVTWFRWAGMLPWTTAVAHRRTFDVVYAVTVFIHQPMTDGSVMFYNVAELVAPGGLLLLGHPLYQQPREGQAWNDVTTWSAEGLAAMAQAAGLDVVELWESPGGWDWGQELGPYHGATQVLRRPPMIADPVA